MYKLLGFVVLNLKTVWHKDQDLHNFTTMCIFDVRGKRPGWFVNICKGVTMYLSAIPLVHDLLPSVMKTSDCSLVAGELNIIRL